MLIDMSWLNVLKVFPPEEELQRLNLYDRYNNFYEGRHEAVCLQGPISRPRPLHVVPHTANYIYHKIIIDLFHLLAENDFLASANSYQLAL